MAYLYIPRGPDRLSGYRIISSCPSFLTRSGTVRRGAGRKFLCKLTHEFPIQVHPPPDDVVIYLDSFYILIRDGSVLDVTAFGRGVISRVFCEVLYDATSVGVTASIRSVVSHSFSKIFFD